MHLERAADRERTPADVPGNDRRVSRNIASGGRSPIVRLEAGARFLPHPHHGQVVVVMLSGEVRIGGGAMSEDHDRHAGAGAARDSAATSGAVDFVSPRKATPRIESLQRE